MDPWQKEVLEHEGNLELLCGRQVGKSEIMAKKIADYLLNHPNQKLLIVSGVERQASGLYNKILTYIEKSFPNMLCKGKKKPLRTILHLRNGSVLITEPVGLDGAGARQHTIHGVIFEEMQLIPEEAFAAITPMLLTTGGFIWMLGTAWSTEGYCYDRLSDPDFKVWRINAEEVAEQRPEPQRTIMLKHLENERKRLTEAEYQQEYLAIPSDKTKQIFPDKLIARQLVAERKAISPSKEYVCGVDPAGMGEDDGSISIFEVDVEAETMQQVEHIITTKLYTTETTERIIQLNRLYDFSKIYVDDGGVGFGVFSELLKEDDTKFKTVPLNNSARPLDYEEKRTTKILYEDMIFNLLNLMEKNRITFLQDSEIRESLKSYKFEKSKKSKNLLITSNYNHPVQSMMRAAWYLQTKHLYLSIHTIKV